MSCPSHVNQSDLANIIYRLDNYFNHYNVPGIQSDKRIGYTKSQVPGSNRPEGWNIIEHSTLAEVANRLGHNSSVSYFLSPSPVPNYVNQNEKIMAVTRDSLLNRMNQLEATCYSCYQGDSGPISCSSCYGPNHILCACDTANHFVQCYCDLSQNVSCTCHNRTVSSLCYCRYGGGTSHTPSPICYPNHGCTSGYTEKDRYSYGDCVWTHVVTCSSPYCEAFCFNQDAVKYCRPYGKQHCTAYILNANCRMCYTANYSYGVACQQNYASEGLYNGSWTEPYIDVWGGCGGQRTILSGYGIGACYSFTPYYQPGCAYNTRSPAPCTGNIVQAWL